MNVTSVAAPPAKPLLIYDGDCRFCTLWIKRWQQTTGDAVDYLPFQDAIVSACFPEIPRQQFETAVQLIETDGRAYHGAEAALRMRAKNPRRQWLWRAYQKSSAFASIAQRSYKFVAEHRTLFSWLTRIAYGNHVEVPSFLLTRWFFLRGLALIYLIAFASLWSQIDGLVGSNGILPANQFMFQVRQGVAAQNIELDRYRLLPTLCWFNDSNTFLHLQCAAGVLLSVLLLAGIAPAPCLFLLWFIYLSLSTVCRAFLGFQWDFLLLETGFLAIFLAPLQLLPRPSREAPPSRLVMWLFRWLLFRLMFESGVVKLASGDTLWRKLTALSVHYETQPLPTWIGWYAHQLPLWIQKLSCLGMFFVELVVPFLFFAPRRLRAFGALATAVLEIFILLTGNYTYFNLLTLTLCLLMLDDFIIVRILPEKVRAFFAHDGPRGNPGPLIYYHFAVTIALAILVISIGSVQVLNRLGIRGKVFTPVEAVGYWLAPYRSINGYGLFAMMTPKRPEIIIEGSSDGINWLPYEFKYKPGDVRRSPGFVAPHQPRLDWQMWFAALSDWQNNHWFMPLIFRLQKNSPEVVALLDKNPFPKTPPRFIRATLYEYHFTTFAERKQTGAWWKRVPIGEYFPPIQTPGASSVPPPKPMPPPQKAPTSPAQPQKKK